MNVNDRAVIIAQAQRWWTVAAEDLRVARACLALAPPSLGNAAYHGQQAAEKVMEGLSLAAGVSFRKVHDLDELASALIPLYPALAADLDRCRPYSSWATDYRYPPEDDAQPPSEAAVSEALENIQKLLIAAAELS